MSDSEFDIVEFAESYECDCENESCQYCVELKTLLYEFIINESEIDLVNFAESYECDCENESCQNCIELRARLYKFIVKSSSNR